jgi:carboxyl-terminal processing protease
MRNTKFSRPFESTTILALVLGLIGGMAVDRIAAAQLAPDGRVNLQLVSQANGIIERFYVDRAAEKSPALTYGAISGMVDALGDTEHSRFLSPGMVQAMADMEKNQFEGIGAEVQAKDGHTVIVAPLDGSPAQRAGLKPGDIIVQVNGQVVDGQPLEQVVEKVSGPAGTPVTLTMLTPSTGQTREVMLTREKFQMHNVTWGMLPGTKIAQLRIAGFETGVSSEVRNALMEIQKQQPSGIVLDLRNNPGGILDEAVDSASEFLKGGNVLLEKNAQGEQKPIPVKAGGQATEIPLVVLINEGTASGAEIVAGAIRDAHRGSLIGQTTFGTGTVLSEFKLADGSALLLAIEEWLTPAGDVIWHKGIAPNTALALPQGVQPVFPEAEHSMSPEKLQNSGDAQLLKALQLLG